MAGNEADDLELVLCCWRVTVAGRVGKRGDFRCIASLFATGDLVGDGHGVCCRKAHVAAQGVGAKGIGFDKRGRFVVAACSVLGIELVFDGRLLLDVVGCDDLLVDLLLLVGEFGIRGG